jgi:two-component system, cell cycle sensor histidine kinase and response regulator CckA
VERIDSDIWSAAEVARLLTLVENEKRYYQEILSLCPVPMAVVGNDFGLHSVNRSFRSLFALKHGETTAVKVTELFPALIIEQRIERALRTHTPEWQTDVTIWLANGQGRACRLSVAPIPNPYGEQPTEVLVVAELPELGQSPASALLDAAGVLAWQMNVATGELVFANAAPGLPASPAEWNARAYKEDQARLDWVYEAALESGKEAEIDYRASWGGWLSDRITPVVADGKVTALRVLTLRIQKRRERLESLVRAREDEAAVRLAQHVAHQFNNIWMIVTGYTEVLREHLAAAEADARLAREETGWQTRSIADAAESESDARLALEEIDRAASRGAAATQQLLQFSRPPAVHLSQVDLQELLTRMEWDADVRFLPGQMLVNLDPAAFRQAMLTLAQETSPYLPAGQRLVVEVGRSMAIHDFADGLPRGHFATISLGPMENISQTKLAHWSEPFFSEEDRTAAIGLAPLVSLLRQMGVTVSMERMNGTAAFVLRMPLVRYVEMSRKAPPEASAAPTPTRESVLVVDGNESVRNLIARFLGREGYRVRMAADSDEALRASATGRESLDLLICDVTLPGLSGPELSAALRPTYPHLRVLFMSGYAAEAALAEAAEKGDSFLQKPFTLAALSEQVRIVLSTPQV